MSMRWALMSRRPSSNTANRPIGPAPTMTTSVLIVSVMGSTLLGGRRHRQAIERRRHLDLAGKARIGAHFEGEIEHIFLHLRGLADDFRPFGVYIDMASGAGAGAAAFGVDAGNALAQRRLHDRLPVLRLDGFRFPLRIYISDVDHGEGFFLTITGGRERRRLAAARKPS